MKIFLIVISIFLGTTSFGQNSVELKVLINGSSLFDGAFLFFPLSNDTLRISGTQNFLLDTTNLKRKLFYCCFKNEKSKIYNLNADLIISEEIDFRVPDKTYFDDLYKSEICPLCHKKDNVISFIYGKPGKELIKLSDEGKLKLAGCKLSNTSPKFYCKTDKLEF